MKRFSIIMALLLTFCCFGGNMQIHGAEPGAAKITVEAEGSGTSKIDALKSAWMEAVRTAVGMFMVANTTMMNDELTEEIATFSRGQVNAYETLSESQTNGIWNIRIRANIDPDILQDGIKKATHAVKVAPDRNVLAKVATGNEQTKSREEVLKASLGLLDFTDCMNYSTKLESYLDEETGQHGFRIRHQLMFDIDKYNNRLNELHLLFGKIAISKKDMSYTAQNENMEILNNLQEKRLRIFDINEYNQKRDGNENPFYLRAATYLPIGCPHGTCYIGYSNGCGFSNGLPFLSLAEFRDSSSYYLVRELPNSLIIPKNAGVGTVYKVQGYRQLPALLLKEARILRFYAGIGKGLSGKIFTSPDIKVVVGVSPAERDTVIALAPMFWMAEHPLGAQRTPGIVFYQKLDLSPEEVAQNKDNINAGYTFD